MMYSDTIRIVYSNREQHCSWPHIWQSLIFAKRDSPCCCRGSTKWMKWIAEWKELQLKVLLNHHQLYAAATAAARRKERQTCNQKDWCGSIVWVIHHPEGFRVHWGPMAIRKIFCVWHSRIETSGSLVSDISSLQIANVRRRSPLDLVQCILSACLQLYWYGNVIDWLTDWR